MEMKNQFFRRGVITAVAASWLIGTACFADEVAATSAGAEHGNSEALLNKVVLIGASVSGGFTQSELFGGPRTEGYKLKHYFDAAIEGEHQPTKAFGGSFFFMNPEKTATACIEKAAAAKPSLVVAIDFLFWFCYGEELTNDQRLDLFEKGLKFLDPIEQPLVIGDIPDASAAVGLMLSQAQVPDAKIIGKCNARLVEWAAAKEHVHILPLSNFLSSCTADKPLRMRDHEWKEGTTKALLQSDQLHPSHEGCAGLTCLALDIALSKHREASDQLVCWDPAKVQKLALAAAKPAPAPAPAPEADPEPEPVAPAPSDCPPAAPAAGEK